MNRSKLINKSRWPTPALEVLTKWIARRAGIAQSYTFEVRSCRAQTWAGCGERYSQWIKLDRHFRRTGYAMTVQQATNQMAVARERLAALLKHRRSLGELQWPDRDGGAFDEIERRRDYVKHALDNLRVARYDERTGRRFRKLWPYSLTDHRFKWSPEYIYRSRFEVLVMLLAHEAYHATGGHPRNFRGRNGRTRLSSMEHQCNEFAYATVEALREQWPKLRGRIYRAMRADRDRKRQAKQAKAARRSPEHKLALADANLVKWIEVRNKAERMIRKYQRAAHKLDRRVAAKRKGRG